MAGELQGLGPVGRLQNRVAAFAERIEDELAKCFVILDEQDRFRPSPSFARAIILSYHLCGLAVDSRQQDFKRRTLSGLAVDPNEAAALFHDSVHGCQTQPRSLASFLGCEERLEDARLSLGIHAEASVRDRKPDERAGGHLRVQASEGTVHFHICGLNGQSSAVWHGVTGVHRQIDDHLFDLPLICLDLPELQIKIGDQVDIFVDQAPQHFLQFVHHGVQIQNPGGQDLLTAECEELAGQRSGAPPGSADFLCLPAKRIALIEALFQISCVPHDYHQQVVEVVGDSAG